MDNLAPYFHGLEEKIYLNTPAVGLIPNRVYEFKEDQNRLLSEKGSATFEVNAGLNDRVREKIGSTFGGKPGYVALFPAFSYGFNAILEGLKPNAKVLLLKNDYPSINWAVEARNFTIRYVPIEADLEDAIYKAFKEDRPDVFIFSQVQYLNGIKLDGDFVKQLKTEFKETLLIADGTQYLGTERFNFADSGIDALGASAYKWIGAGFGNGFFMFKPGVEAFIEPKYLGFGSVMGKYKESGDTLIGKLEGNHLDPANIGAIQEGIAFQEKLGFAKIETQIRKLGEAAKQAFSELGLLEESVSKRKDHSSIFNLKGDDSLFDQLVKNNVFCAQRGAGIRVGFHYYNTLEDLERLIQLLKS